VVVFGAARAASLQNGEHSFCTLFLHVTSPLRTFSSFISAVLFQQFYFSSFISAVLFQQFYFSSFIYENRTLVRIVAAIRYDTGKNLFQTFPRVQSRVCDGLSNARGSILF
jgi:hypothetical protein